MNHMIHQNNNIMRQIVTMMFVLICISVNFLCKDNKSGIKKTGALKFLSGYWIPKEIAWGGDDLNSKDTGDVFRTASFKTLCFDTSGRFIYFASTQRRPKNYDDSMIFAGEPVVKMYKGNWNGIDTSLEVSYKVVAEGSTPVDSAEKHEQIRVIYHSIDTMLLFRKQLYVRTL